MLKFQVSYSFAATIRAIVSFSSRLLTAHAVLALFTLDFEPCNLRLLLPVLESNFQPCLTNILILTKTILPEALFFRQNYWLKFSILRAKINTFVFPRK